MGKVVAVKLLCYIVIKINLPLFYKEDKELVLPPEELFYCSLCSLLPHS